MQYGRSLFDSNVIIEATHEATPDLLLTNENADNTCSSFREIMSCTKEILHDVAARAGRYLNGLEVRSVFPAPSDLAALSAFDEPVPEEPSNAAAVLAMLDGCGSPATIAMAGPRYFGFVIGGSLPAALAANWMAGAWDQNPGLVIGSPVACALEEVSLHWLIELLGLPVATAAGFVTGATMANFTALAAARHAVLARVGWNVEAQGLSGAPAITVIVGEEVHVSVLKAISMLGLGRERVTRVPWMIRGGCGPMRCPAYRDRRSSAFRRAM